MNDKITRHRELTATERAWLEASLEILAFGSGHIAVASEVALLPDDLRRPVESFMTAPYCDEAAK